MPYSPKEIEAEIQKDCCRNCQTSFEHYRRFVAARSRRFDPFELSSARVCVKCDILDHTPIGQKLVIEQIAESWELAAKLSQQFSVNSEELSKLDR